MFFPTPKHNFGDLILNFKLFPLNFQLYTSMQFKTQFPNSNISQIRIHLKYNQNRSFLISV